MKVLIVFAISLIALTCAQRAVRQNDNAQYQAQQQQQQAPQQSLTREQQFREKHETTTWIPIIRYSKDQSKDGSYKTEYETGNNIVAEEAGYLKQGGTAEDPKNVLVQEGSYSYVAPDGTPVFVQYTADDGGFRAVGDAIPTAPPVPPEIQKGLDQIYAGIKLQQEQQAQRLKTDPEYAKTQEERARLDYLGLYYERN